MAVSWSHLRSARRCARQGNWRQAAAHYARLIRKDARHPNIHIQYAHSLKEDGQNAAALVAYRAAAERFPLDARTHVEFAHFLRRSGFDAGAARAVTRALMLEPNRQDSLRLAADMGLDGLEVREMSVLAWLECAPAAGRTSPLATVRRALSRMLHLRRARGHARARRWDRAAAGYRALVAVDRDNPRLFVQFGHALKESGDLDGARGAYYRALLLDPRSPDAFIALAHALRLGGDPEGALLAYLTAWRLRPGHPDAAVELAQAGWSAAQLDQLSHQSWRNVLDPAGVAMIEGQAGAFRPDDIPAVVGFSRRESRIWQDLLDTVGSRA